MPLGGIPLIPSERGHLGDDGVDFGGTYTCNCWHGKLVHAVKRHYFLDTFQMLHSSRHFGPNMVVFVTLNRRKKRVYGAPFGPRLINKTDKQL